MEHAVRLPNRRTLAIPLVAAVLGAGAATTAYVLTDGETAPAPKVVVVGSSGSDSAAEPVPMSGHRP
jgi:hypothetical protein